MQGTREAEQTTLRRYLRVLSRRWKLIAIVTVLAVAGGAALSFAKSPVYQAEARVLVQPRAGQSIFDVNSGLSLDPAVAVETEMEVMESPAVKARAARKVGAVPDVRTRRAGDTLIIVAAVRADEPARAAAMATAYARAYIELRREQRVEDILAAGDEIQKKISAVESQIDDIETELRDEPGAGTGDLGARHEALLAQLARFNEKRDQLEVDASISAGGASLVAAARRPTTPAEPRPVRTLAFALIAGLAAGAGLASLVEAVDESLKTRDDVRDVSGLPVLAAVPSFPDATDLVPADTPASEAYRALRTSVQLLNVTRPFKTIQLTSPGSGEGKTTTVVNLAAAIAATGLRVAVVDCDLRRPRVHELLGVGRTPGLTTVLTNEVPLDAAIQQHGAINVLAAGPPAPNPSELLGSRRMSEVLFALHNMFDVVVVDSPPVLPVADAVLVAAWVETTIVVVRAGRTGRNQLRGALETLSQVDANVPGVVLNGAETDATYGYAYGYPASSPPEPSPETRTDPQPASAAGRVSTPPQD